MQVETHKSKFRNQNRETKLHEEHEIVNRNYKPGGISNRKRKGCWDRNRDRDGDWDPDGDWDWDRRTERVRVEREYAVWNEWN